MNTVAVARPIRRFVAAAVAGALGAACAPQGVPNDASPASANVAAPAAPAPAPPPAMATIPERFRGIYDSSAETCGRPSEYRLIVSALELRFHESIGRVSAVVPAGGEGIQVIADFEGEGESWTAVRELRLAPDGATLNVAGDGTSLTRTRCTAAG